MSDEMPMADSEELDELLRQIDTEDKDRVDRLSTSGEFGTLTRCLRDEELVLHSFECAECSRHFTSEETFKFDLVTGKLELEKGHPGDPYYETAVCECGNKTFRAEPEDHLCGYCRHMAEKD